LRIRPNRAARVRLRRSAVCSRKRRPLYFSGHDTSPVIYRAIRRRKSLPVGLSRQARPYQRDSRQTRDASVNARPNPSSISDARAGGVTLKISTALEGPSQCEVPACLSTAVKRAEEGFLICRQINVAGCRRIRTRRGLDVAIVVHTWRVPHVSVHHNHRTDDCAAWSSRILVQNAVAFARVPRSACRCRRARRAPGRVLRALVVVRDPRNVQQRIYCMRVLAIAINSSAEPHSLHRKTRAVLSAPVVSTKDPSGLNAALFTDPL
jgi:hypothetical protein